MKNESSKISRCLFPVAGRGTRFLPVTKEIAKEMLPLVNRPIISYSVEEAVASGCHDIVMVTGRTKHSIQDYFDDNRCANFIFVCQQEPLGLGHAVLCGKPICKDDYFGVILPDDVIVAKTPALLQLIDIHEKFGGSVLALKEVSDDNVSRFGIVDAECVSDGVYKIRDMVEKPSFDKAPSKLAIMGRYILSPTIFDILSNTKSGIGNEIQLTDALCKLLQTETIWGIVYKGEHFDCGTQAGWLGANIKLALQIPELKKIVLDIVDTEQNGGYIKNENNVSKR